VSDDAPRVGARFDLDGTLVDSLPTVGAAMSQALRDFGHHFSAEEIVPLIGAPMPLLAAEMTGVSTEIAEQMNERYLELYYKDFIQTTRPFDGATALLERLAAAEMPLGVVTNKNEHGGKLMVEIQQWERFFSIVVGRDTADRPKPFPDGSLLALDALKVTPARAAFVGDTEFDMHAARDAQIAIRVGLLGARNAQQLDEAGATHVVSDLEAVGEVILEAVSLQSRAAAES
jgi:HAD superfamily hydrolase (TIGR01509 family)